MLNLIEGVILGLGYVMPIGAQNLYVIQSSISNNKKNAFLNSILIISMDISLAIFCFFGAGSLISRFPLLAGLVQFLGGIYLLKIGTHLLRNAGPSIEKTEEGSKFILIPALKSAFVFTWFNPQAIIDGAILFGSIKSTLGYEDSKQFMLGICIASSMWFLSLTAITNVLGPKFDNKTIITINKICGLALAFFGAKLILNILTQWIKP